MYPSSVRAHVDTTYTIRTYVRAYARTCGRIAREAQEDVEAEDDGSTSFPPKSDTYARAFVESSAMAWLIACVCSGDHRLRCTDDRPTPLREMDPPQLAINSGRGGHPRHPGGQTHHQWSNEQWAPAARNFRWVSDYTLGAEHGIWWYYPKNAQRTD